MTIYSTRFIGEVNNGGYGALYTVPGNKVAVIRSVNVVSGAPGVSDAQLLVNGTFWLFRVDPLAANAVGSWEGRQVLNPNDTLRTYVGGGPAHWAVSGYLLDI
jgi:hypothetical protein